MKPSHLSLRLLNLRIARLLPAMALVLAVALAGAGCSKESKIAKHLKKGDSFFASGEYDKARLEYMGVVQLDPRNAHAIGQLGHIFFENGIVLQAGAAFEQAIKLGDVDPQIQARLGTLLAGGKRFTAAREHALKAIESDPTQEDALFLLADLANDETSAAEFKSLVTKLRAQKGNLPVYDAAEAAVTLKRRDVAGALTLAQRAVAGAPESAAAQFVLAGVYLSQTNFADGSTALAKAAALSPPRSNRRIQYFNFLMQRGSTNEAGALLDKLIKEAPDFVPARLRKAQVAFARREYDVVSTELSAILTRDPVNIEARLQEAQLHLAKREPDKAQQLMEQVTKQFPQSAQLQYQAALVSLANQNPAQAQLQLDRAYELDPNIPETVLLRGRLYLARGQAGEVVKSLQQLIATNATVRPAYQLLGEALLAGGNADRAMAVFRDYTNRFASDPVGPQAIGVLYLRSKDSNKARQSFESAFALRPDYLPAIEQLVRLDIAENKATNAVARARKFVDQQPKNAEARVLLAQAQLAARDSKSAEGELEQAIELNPQLQPAYIILAELYSRSDRQADALDRLQAFLKEKPDDQKTLMMLGILYTQMGKVDEAAGAYEKVLEKNDAFVPALNNLAYIDSEKLDKLDRAYELARKSRQLAPNDPSIADTLGWILYHRHEYAQALVHLEESAAKLSQNAEVQYHLGMAHYAMAHEGPARAAFQLALSLDPKADWRMSIDDRMAVLDANVGNADPETLKRLEHFESEHKDDVLLLSRLGRAQESARNWDAAQATYQRAAAASPEAVLPLIGQARVAAAKGDFAEALTIARKTRDMVKSDPPALYELGRVAYLAHDYPWSYALLQESATGTSDSPQTQFAFAQSALAVGRLDVARGALEKINPIATNPRAALQLMLLPFCGASSVQALPADVSAQLAAAQPGELLADFLKARLKALAGDAGAAVQGMETLLNSYPQFTPAKKSLALILVDRPAETERTEKLAREVREAQPNDPEMAKVLGQLAYGRADYKYAADMLQEASRTLTGDGELMLLLGQARAQTKQVADARQAINKALSLPLSDAQKQKAQQLLQQLK